MLFLDNIKRKEDVYEIRLFSESNSGNVFALCKKCRDELRKRLAVNVDEERRETK